MSIHDLIAAKRDGRRHSEADLRWLAEVAAHPTTHGVEDYQLSAWLMAAYLNPLDEEETTSLTLAMAGSGERLDLSGLPHPWIDKHSTGGVGDKTSISLLPILAACGLTVVKMSGRGLGITGGTIDKLSSIPGFRLDLSPAEMVDQASRIGLALTGQTANLAPADKTLYALRDATETVASIPLIVSSILSKKLAGGSELLGLDVKCGSGGFMRTLAEARLLATWLIEISRRCGLSAHASITDMDQPLGRCAGNALEVCEAFELLRPGHDGGRYGELVFHLAGETLFAAHRVASLEEGKRLARERRDAGEALTRARHWVEAQGGDPDVVDDPGRLHSAPVIAEVPAIQPGSLRRIDAETVGRTVLALGGGRQRANDKIDLGVGVETLVCVGDEVSAGQPLFRVHAACEESARLASTSLLQGLQISNERIEPNPLVLETMN